MAGGDAKGVGETVQADAREVRKSAKHLERSAGAVKQGTQALKSSAERATELAADRTILAGERTYAAWVRTGLAALASGVGARALLAELLPPWLGTLTASVLVVFGMFCFVAAVWRELAPGAPPPVPDTKQMPAALLLAFNGFLVLISAAALVAIWLHPA